jgi:ribose/xylose/arabinose/galactoside ABC-type transport system permease subunit
MARFLAWFAAASKRLDDDGASRDWRDEANRGTTMEAIYAIVIFVVAMFALNRFEFGRFD